MKFVTYCRFCDCKVTAYTLLGGDELKSALESNGEIQVGHVANVDHQWKLIKSERENLRNQLASGALSLGASS